MRLLFTVLFLWAVGVQAQVMIEPATGEYSHHYLKIDGTLWYTQLTAFNSAYAQRQITGADSIVQIDGGQYTSIFLRKNGAVFSATGNSDNLTAYATDYTNATFRAVKVYAMWRMGVAIDSLGRVYYWSLAQGSPEDMLQQFGSLTTPVPKPRLLVQPSGKTIVKCVFGAGLSPYGGAFLWGLASDGTLWQWDASNTTPFQVLGKTGFSNRWTGVVTNIVANFDCRIVITSTNQAWAWGYNAGNYGGHFDYQNQDMDNIAGNMTSQGVQFPIKQIVASYLTIQLIDATNSRYGIGTDQTGNLGSGYMWPSFRTNYAGSTPTPWAYNYQPYSGLQSTWLKMPGQWAKLKDNSSFVFYTFGQDMGGNWYAWGRGKDESNLSGIASQAADQSSYPDWLTIPSPRVVSPFTQTWIVEGPVDTTMARKPIASAGPYQFLHGVTSFVLGGAASHQNQPTAGGITITMSNVWSLISGPNTPTFTTTAVNPTVTGAVPGTYIFQNKVTNSNAAVDSQRTQVTISDTHMRYLNADSGSDNNDGYTMQTAWKTIAPLNTGFTSLSAGDSVFFARGDTFNGTITIAKTGTSIAPITFTSYGTGAKPVLTQFATTSTWTNEGGGIYSAPFTSSTLTNMVTIDGVQYNMGRFPDGSTYRTYQSFNTTTKKIVSTGASAIDWSLNGTAEAVIRLNDFFLDRCKIDSQKVDSIFYTNNGSGSSFFVNNYGYFIQNDLRTLTQYGEWFHNTSTNKLYVYFGGGGPTGHVVKAAVANSVIINSSTYDYITLDGLQVQGANVDAISYTGSGEDGMIVKNCDISFAGNRGLYYFSGAGGFINNNTVNHSNSSGISTDATNATVTNNTLTNIGMQLGQVLGGSGMDAMRFVGNGTVGYYNTIRNVGATGFVGKNTGAFKFMYNRIDSTEQLMDDGGGFYIAGPDAGVREIAYNIITNVYGNYSGTSRSVSFSANGYLDEGTTNAYIHHNTFSGSPYAGLKIHKSGSNRIEDNLMYDNLYGLSAEDDNLGQTTNNTLRRNTMVAKTSSQYPASYITGGANDSLYRFFIADSNYYSRPIAEGATIRTYVAVSPFTPVLRTIANWSTKSGGQDAHSLASPKTISSTSEIIFTTNYSAVPLVTNFTGLQRMKMDGSTVNNTNTTPAYGSDILFTNGSLAGNPVVTNGSYSTTSTSATLGVTVTGGTTPYTYAWSFVSGPNTPTLSSTTAANPTISGLVTGTYVYSVTITDAASLGGSGTSTVIVTLPVAGGGVPVLIFGYRVIN